MERETDEEKKRKTSWKNERKGNKTKEDKIKNKDENEEIYIFSLKIPAERIAALIGKNGETKREIESITKCSLKVDSKEGEIHIESTDSIRLYNTKEIVKAIGRGFNPKIAMLLLKPDYVMEIIELRSIAKSASHIKRMKGRVIGEGGKCRKTIEDLTETFISVYGKTIGVIGEASKAEISKRAIESLLRGSPHSTVYNWLEKQRKHLKEEDFLKDFDSKEREEFEEADEKL